MNSINLYSVSVQEAISTLSNKKYCVKLVIDFLPLSVKN